MCVSLHYWDGRGNIVPDKAVVWYYMRAFSEVVEMLMNSCEDWQSAAMMTETKSWK